MRACSLLHGTHKVVVLSGAILPETCAYPSSMFASGFAPGRQARIDDDYLPAWKYQVTELFGRESKEQMKR
jgi:hypothetical protein